MKREFYVLRNDLKIYVKEFIEAGGDEKKPAIIFSHGFGGNHQAMEYYCKQFAALGYATYCYDFCGGSVGDTGKSDGDSLAMSISTECDDLCAVLEEVQSYSYVDATRITLCGESQGGFVSSLVAAYHKEEVASLMLIYPAFCIPDDARLYRLGGATYSKENVPKVIECPNGMRISTPYHESVVDMDPYQVIREFKGPVLLLQGKCDSVVNYSYGIKAKESYAKGQCQLCMLEETDHYFPPAMQENAFIMMENFLRGKRELLTIQVFVTGAETVEDTKERYEGNVFFTGYCDNERFRGCIVPEGVDNQVREGDGPVKLHADYTLVGLDAEGENCSIHIVNQMIGDRYKPVVKTDSEALSFLQEADLTAVLTGFTGGLTVRIWG